jgi:mRNA-degrading endonuclease toxin of MazEF toxin-antitoxin module
VHWIDLPACGGRAQTGRCPAIIVQSISSLLTTLIVPFTSQLDALRFAGTVLVEADSNNGLRRASVAFVFQLAAVDHYFTTNNLGTVSSEVIEEIWTAFDKLIGHT